MEKKNADMFRIIIERSVETVRVYETFTVRKPVSNCIETLWFEDLEKATRVFYATYHDELRKAVAADDVTRIESTISLEAVADDDLAIVLKIEDI